MNKYLLTGENWLLLTIITFLSSSFLRWLKISDLSDHQTGRFLLFVMTWLGILFLF